MPMCPHHQILLRYLLRAKTAAKDKVKKKFKTANPRVFEVSGPSVELLKLNGVASGKSSSRINANIWLTTVREDYRVKPAALWNAMDVCHESVEAVFE